MTKIQYMKIDQDSAHVKFPPPFMLLASIVLGGLLHLLYPLYLVPTMNFRWALATVFICSGLGTILYCASLFKKVKTNIEPWKPTSRIVANKFYRFSRNPIYLSFILTGLGAAFAVNSLWIALLQIPLIVALRVLVINKEEHYLEQKFGEEYRSYKNQVRRWI